MVGPAALTEIDIVAIRGGKKKYADMAGSTINSKNVGGLKDKS